MLHRQTCLSCYFPAKQCAEDDATREIISRHGGLELLVQLMTSRTFEKQLLAATVGALWKCSLNKNNVKRYRDTGQKF